MSPTCHGGQPTSHIVDHVPHRLPRPPSALRRVAPLQTNQGAAIVRLRARTMGKECTHATGGSMGAATVQEVERMPEDIGHRLE